MKAPLLLFVALALPVGPALAQPYPQCSYTYFKGTKKVSTSQCFDPGNRFGEAKAFARDGREIYRHGLRHIAGHESVTFKFYPSGAVQQAYMSSAPDGGIQWYHTTTEFAENGTVTAERHDDYDSHITVQTPWREPPPPPVPNPPCAALLQAECWFVNRSGRTAQVVVQGKDNGEQYLLRLPANGRDTLRSHRYQLTQTYQAPTQRYTLAALSWSGSKLLAIKPLPKPFRDLNPNQRRYYFEVR